MDADRVLGFAAWRSIEWGCRGVALLVRVPVWLGYGLLVLGMALTLPLILAAMAVAMLGERRRWSR